MLYILRYKRAHKGIDRHRPTLIANQQALHEQRGQQRFVELTLPGEHLR